MHPFVACVGSRIALWSVIFTQYKNHSFGGHDLTIGIHFFLHQIFWILLSFMVLYGLGFPLIWALFVNSYKSSSA